MDDFGGTFLDLSASSPFSLCSTSANTNSNGSSSSFTFSDNNLANSSADKLLQSHVDDIDSMLLPTSTDSTSGNADHPKDLSALLDNLTEDALADVNDNCDPLSIDSIIGNDQKLDVHTVFNSKPGQQVVKEQFRQTISLSASSEKVAQSSNMVQVKLLKPVVGFTSSFPSLNANSMIPVTVHSLTGQKHSVMHTVLPICRPRVHLLPTGNRPMLKQASIKQEHQENIEKYSQSFCSDKTAGSNLLVKTDQRLASESPASKTQTIRLQQPKLSLSDPSHLHIIVCNVVASFRVRCHLNLRQIALQSIDVVYRREAQKVVMRMRKPRCTAYMWSSGKIVCTGSNSEESAKKAAKKFCRRLLKIGFKIRFADFKIVNVLAVSKMPYAINIRDFSQAHKGKFCSYEPELHPGVTFRDAASKATLKIFSTGSVTVTGRTVSRATEAIRNVFPSFRDYYKFDKPNSDLNYDDALPSDTEDFS